MTPYSLNWSFVFGYDDFYKSKSLYCILESDNAVFNLFIHLQYYKSLAEPIYFSQFVVKFSTKFYISSELTCIKYFIWKKVTNFYEIFLLVYFLIYLMDWFTNWSRFCFSRLITLSLITVFSQQLLRELLIYLWSINLLIFLASVVHNNKAFRICLYLIHWLFLSQWSLSGSQSWFIRLCRHCKGQRSR